MVAWPIDLSFAILQNVPNVGGSYSCWQYSKWRDSPGYATKPGLFSSALIHPSPSLLRIGFLKSNQRDSNKAGVMGFIAAGCGEVVAFWKKKPVTPGRGVNIPGHDHAPIKFVPSETQSISVRFRSA
jgi:hypothetical protein